MRTIGVRELRQHASRWLALVRAGERITVTDRGRPVAQLVPLAEPGLAELVEGGLASAAEGDLLDVLAAAGGPTAGRSLSAVLDEQRADER